nr:MAG TPA: minor tail protein [Caudoviricetes sp.]
MALKTLPWCPQPGYSVDEEPKRKVLNFGNGYQQRMASSLTI